jgi:hypothetical protein
MFRTFNPAVLLGGLVMAAVPIDSFGSGFAFEETERQLKLLENGQPALVFNHGMVEPAGDGIARSGYIHPLFGPEGEALTEDFPADHLHHRGLYVAWPVVLVGSRQFDLWHLQGIRPVFEKWGHRQANPSAASFEVANLWRLTDGDLAVAREHLRYVVHATDGVGRMIDLTLTLTNLHDEPITLKGSPVSAYGGLNLRLDGSQREVLITTANGRVEGQTNAVEPPSPWADHVRRSGPEKAFAGVAIFQHPANPGYPARNWTLRPYGLHAAAWPGEGSHRIAAGESLVLRYRLFVHRGTAEEAAVAERFSEYATSSSQRE